MAEYVPAGACFCSVDFSFSSSSSQPPSSRTFALQITRRFRSSNTHCSCSPTGSLTTSCCGGRLTHRGRTRGSLCILVPAAGLRLAHDLSLVTGLQGRHDWLVLAGGGVLLFLPQSLVEEMLSRGYLFSALRDGVGEIGALAITSLGFGLLHMGNPGATAQSVSVVVLAGIFLGAILVITRSLYAAWMAHFAWNWSMADLLHAPVI